MPIADYIRLLKTTRRMTELRGLESLITFVLTEAGVLTGAEGGYIVLFSSDSLMPEPAFLGPAGRKLSLPVSPDIWVAYEKTLPHNELAWCHESDPILCELGIKARSALYLPFLSKGGLRGGITLGNPNPALNPHQRDLLLSFAEHAAACLENALVYRKMEDRVNYLSDYDDLITKLPNHKAFRRMLAEAISQTDGQSLLAVLFIDLDDLTRVNRRWGHRIGDLLLYLVARRMATFVQSRGIGSLPARIGGDEFALLLKDITDPQDARLIALEMLADIRKPLDLNGASHVMTASIGIGLYPQDAQTPEGILLCTGQAMYASKDQGKDRYSFYSLSENS
jgi:diguanylate cyclase (GGDEF)-like protein